METLKYESTYGLKNKVWTRLYPHIFGLHDECDIVDIKDISVGIILVPEMIDDIFFKIYNLLKMMEEEGYSQIFERFSRDEIVNNYIGILIPKIANYFELEVSGDSVNEQLSWLINEVSKKGIYVVFFGPFEIGSKIDRRIHAVDILGKYIDCLEFALCQKSDLIPGVRISDGVNTVTSYDKQDIEFIRQRINKDKK